MSERREACARAIANAMCGHESEVDERASQVEELLEAHGAQFPAPAEQSVAAWMVESKHDPTFFEKHARDVEELRADPAVTITPLYRFPALLDVVDEQEVSVRDGTLIPVLEEAVARAEPIVLTVTHEGAHNLLAALRSHSSPPEPQVTNDVRVALGAAAKWFREYEAIHANKPDEALTRKAARNRERAEYCEAALASSPQLDPRGQKRLDEMLDEAANKAAWCLEHGATNENADVCRALIRYREVCIRLHSHALASSPPSAHATELEDEREQAFAEFVREWIDEEMDKEAAIADLGNLCRKYYLPRQQLSLASSPVPIEPGTESAAKLADDLEADASAIDRSGSRVAAQQLRDIAARVRALTPSPVLPDGKGAVVEGCMEPACIIEERRFRVAILQAAEWFREYEAIHAAKETSLRDDGHTLFADDARQKAKRNRERAEYLEQVLAYRALTTPSAPVLLEVREPEPQGAYRHRSTFYRAVDALLAKRVRLFIGDDSERETWVNAVANEIEEMAERIRPLVALSNQGAREPEGPRPRCTGAEASWCPVCGDCDCPRAEDGARLTKRIKCDLCPLHGFASKHNSGGAREEPLGGRRIEGWATEGGYDFEFTTRTAECPPWKPATLVLHDGSKGDQG